MIDLLTEIYNIINSLHNRTFYRGEVPGGTTFPYIEYAIISDSMLEDRTDNILEIDIWHKKDKTNYDTLTSIETIASNLEKLLNNECKITDEFSISFDKLSRLNVPDSDKNVLRRQLRYRVRTFYR